MAYPTLIYLPLNLKMLNPKNYTKFEQHPQHQLEQDWALNNESKYTLTSLNLRCLFQLKEVKKVDLPVVSKKKSSAKNSTI